MEGDSRKAICNPIDRYQTLRLKESLSTPFQYILACKELSFILKNAYSKFPKNLQSLIFQDTLFAFSLLPEMQTQSAISAANSLLQSAEFALPKQKRATAVTEHKHAVVASKRKSKAKQEEEGTCYRKFKSYRGYCSSCCSVVWLSCNRCANKSNIKDGSNHQIKPISRQQIVEYILDGFLVSESSSDSDSDPEDVCMLKLWAYPRQIEF
ncbi:UNVERIFIED_CONTAM: F-box protein [Sesamum radiatum]|uniref:F-box protein n=1 Tax=Sesamum radiatum TaxID=300843 RepID=A0AAW2KBW7_SESRA